MRKRGIQLLILLVTIGLTHTLVQAEEKKQIILSKFKTQTKTIKALTRTKFEVTDSKGHSKIVDLKGKKFIVVSVSEPGSEGTSYAVDEDATIWWLDKISSGAYGGHETPNGIYPILLKRRYHMSAAHPSSDGVNNMDFEMLFTQYGHALHLGNVRALSHGCIHVGRKDVETMFNWVDLKTKVVIMRGHYRQFVDQEIADFKKELKNYDKLNLQH